MPFSPRSIPLIGLISAESLSLLGNQMAAVAIPLLVLQHTGSAWLTGLSGAVSVMPVLLAALMGGQAIDHFGPWRASLLADLCSFASTLGLPLAFVLLEQVPMALVLMLIFAGALFDPTGSAARQTMVPGLARLAGRPLEGVNTLRGGLENGADFAGPLLAAALVGLIGAAPVLYLNALSFLICAVLLLLLVPRRRQWSATPQAGPMLVGVRFILHHPELRALALAGMAANFALAPFLGLLLPLLAVQLHHSAALLGLCLSAFGVCAMCGAFSFAWLSRRLPRSAIFYGGLLCTALAILLCSLPLPGAGLVVGAALAGLLLGAGNPLEATLLQASAPRAMAGQIFTAMGAIRFAAGPLGLLLAGLVAEYHGTASATQLAGISLLLAALVGWWWAPLKAR